MTRICSVRLKPLVCILTETHVSPIHLSIKTALCDYTVFVHVCVRKKKGESNGLFLFLCHKEKKNIKINE